MHRAVETYGLRVDIDPAEALLEEVYWTAGHVQWLRGIIQSLAPDALTWGIAEEAEKGATEFPGTDVLKKASVNVWLQLYQVERKHLVDVCTAALKVGIEKRRVDLAERQGDMIAEVFRRVFDDPEFGLDEAQREVARGIASRHLRLLATS
ncbi:MAG: hypothetical protein KGR26_06900 [Cyanobacteria bacterium REEB65]|nr:hypothetical protein [Cyanobacteria bacterium REEB65]